MAGDPVARIRAFAAEAVLPARLPAGAGCLIAVGWATVETESSLSGCNSSGFMDFDSVQLVRPQFDALNTWLARELSLRRVQASDRRRSQASAGS